MAVLLAFLNTACARQNKCMCVFAWVHVCTCLWVIKGIEQSSAPCLPVRPGQTHPHIHLLHTILLVHKQQATPARTRSTSPFTTLLHNSLHACVQRAHTRRTHLDLLHHLLLPHAPEVLVAQDAGEDVARQRLARQDCAAVAQDAVPCAAGRGMGGGMSFPTYNCRCGRTRPAEVAQRSPRMPCPARQAEEWEAYYSDVARKRLARQDCAAVAQDAVPCAEEWEEEHFLLYSLGSNRKCGRTRPAKVAQQPSGALRRGMSQRVVKSWRQGNGTPIRIRVTHTHISISKKKHRGW